MSRYFERVIGTDASLRQIEAARPQDGIEYRVAPAEDSGLPAESIGLVTVAQALHWFDIGKFFGEAQRVLVPNGVLSFWCYGLCSVADGLDDLLAEIYSFVNEY